MFLLNNSRWEGTQADHYSLMYKTVSNVLLLVQLNNFMQCDRLLIVNKTCAGTQL